ncbi:MAG: hypothetical protein ACRDHX_03850 [Chloroflexota bacterium]
MAASSVAPSAGATGVPLPAYVPFKGAKPDFPGGADGIILPGYLTYPKEQPATVPQPFGKGETVTIMTETSQAPPAPVGGNAAWQHINKAMGVNLDLTPVQLADYPVKLNTVIAGGASQLPDLLSIGTGKGLSNLPQLLSTLFQDLTPFLAGDAIKAYPNLASLPPFAWRNCVFNGKIYCVPSVSGGVAGPVMFAHGTLTQSVGGVQFKDSTDFTRAMKALTKPGAQYGLTVSAGQTAGVPNTASWFTEVFGAPNDWRESGGKLTKNWETAEFKAAIGFARDLWSAGVIYPGSTNQGVVAAAGTFYSGKAGLWQNGFVIGDIVWNHANSTTPNFTLQAVIPFSPDGGKTKPVHHLGSGAFFLSVLKKAPEDKIKLGLEVLNWLAAPFGTAEYLLKIYGVEGIDFKYDAHGNPIATKKGLSEGIGFPLKDLVSPPNVMYDSASEDYARVMYPAEKALQEMGVQSPVVGLYSETDGEKGTVMAQKMGDGLNDIIFGRTAASSYDQLVKDWRSAGGDQMRAEYEKALQASH